MQAAHFRRCCEMVRAFQTASSVDVAQVGVAISHFFSPDSKKEDLAQDLYSIMKTEIASAPTDRLGMATLQIAAQRCGFEDFAFCQGARLCDDMRCAKETCLIYVPEVRHALEFFGLDNYAMIEHIAKSLEKATVLSAQAPPPVKLRHEIVEVIGEFQGAALGLASSKWRPRVVHVCDALRTKIAC